MKFVSDYLEILPSDSELLGGLRWSDAHAYVEYGDGKTFAHVIEVFTFLEGFGSQRPLMHFGHVLHFLYLLRNGRTPRPWFFFPELSEAWRLADRPARTAGAMCASLCQDVPPLSDPPRQADLPVWLTVFSRTTADDFQVQQPRAEAPLTPENFERILHEALKGYTKDELVHWFRHGQGPVPHQGEDLANALLAAKPPSLENVLAELSKHDRLSGAVPFVARLVSALSLPPRRMTDRELPIGGYADVTTRGHPEQILAGQFALDELEFLRRYAENELLFYRREEPASRTREELVVLLDQGVRTWGRVRLVLAAAVFALGQFARRRRMPMLLAATSNKGRIVDPLATPVVTVAEMLAASDLTANPGLALENVLTDQETVRRDVVLLTHPRNLAEPDVQTAARMASVHTRLFAVAVDGHGEVLFNEVRRGGCMTIGTFRIDFGAPPPALAVVKTDSRWRGDIEPVGFPFRFGLDGNETKFLFAFDYAGEWALAAGHGGMLCACRTDGTSWEMLPRPFVRGEVLTTIDSIQGVSGGFIIAGAMRGRLVAFHYNFSKRDVKCHEFVNGDTLAAQDAEWRYSRRKHMMILRAGSQFCGVSLATGKRIEPVPVELRWFPKSTETPPINPLIHLPAREAEHSSTSGANWWSLSFALDQRSGTLIPRGSFPAGWNPFTPLSDGKPALVGRVPLRAELRANVLALMTTTSEHRKELFIFNGPGGETIAHFPIPFDHCGLALSEDGQLLALERKNRLFEVYNARSGDLEVRCVSPVGRFHNNLNVELGDRWLSIGMENNTRHVHWIDGTLSLPDRWPRSMREKLSGEGKISSESQQARAGRLPAFLQYDTRRFRLAVWSKLIAVVDHFGQVFLFERSGEIVCAFFVFRRQFAAWMPDGTCYGDEALLGRPATPNALERIGQALLRAWQKGKGAKS